MPLAPISIVRWIAPVSALTCSRSVPRPVIHRLPRSQTIRSGASPSIVASRLEPFVARSMRVNSPSRWLITHPAAPLNAMSDGPSPTTIRATTMPVRGETRTTRAPWSSATQTEPPPIQMLYAAASESLIVRATFADDAFRR